MKSRGVCLERRSAVNFPAKLRFSEAYRNLFFIDLALMKIASAKIHNTEGRAEKNLPGLWNPPRSQTPEQSSRAQTINESHVPKNTTAGERGSEWARGLIHYLIQHNTGAHRNKLAIKMCGYCIPIKLRGCNMLIVLAASRPVFSNAELCCCKLGWLIQLFHMQRVAEKWKIVREGNIKVWFSFPPRALCFWLHLTGKKLLLSL